MVVREALVCIDATPLDTAHRLRGIGRYVQGLLDGLGQTDPPLGLTCLRVKGYDKAAGEGGAYPVVGIRRPARPRVRLQWVLNELLLAGEVAGTGCRLFHATDPRGIALGRGYRTVATAYDLAHLRFPEEYFATAPRDERAALRRMCARYRRADHLIAISNATKQEFVTLLGVDPECVSVVPLGFDLTRFPACEEGGLRRLALPERFFLYTGAVDPRKNVHGMLRAYRQVKGSVPESLVLAGHLDAASAMKVRAWITELGLEERVKCVGYIPDPLLGVLYREATAFVFPSRYEGFGFPALEAMGCGCPVITGSGSSLPEVVGDAGLTADVEEDDALAAAMRRLSEDEALRQELRERGRTRASGFTWARCARETLEVYERLIGR